MIYCNNRYDNIGDIDVIANEAYDDVSGAYALLEDNARNEQAMFEALIAFDIEEARCKHGIVSESAYEVMTEGAISNIWEKIKSFVKKVWEKIKGIFTHFMAKLNSYIMKDGKAFVAKYKKHVTTKEFSKFKYKWRKPTGKNIEYDKSANAIMDVVGKTMTGRNDSNNFDERITDKTKIKNGINSELAPTVKKYVDDTDSWKSYIYSSLGLNNAEDSTLAKDISNHLYEDEEEFEGDTHLSEIMNDIENGKGLISDMNKRKEKFDRAEKNIINFIDKQRTGFSKDFENNKVGIKQANAASSLMSTHQTLMSKVFSCELSEAKKHIARCRAIFVKMVAYNPKNVKESALLEEAAYESALYDAESTLFGYDLV